MVLRAGWLSPSGPVVYMSFCAQAIEYAALNGARVLNCSWDSIGDAQYGLAAALDVAINTYGVVVVGSAGNAGTSSTASQYLASREDCLGVAGVLESGSEGGREQLRHLGRSRRFLPGSSDHDVPLRHVAARLRDTLRHVVRVPAGRGGGGAGAWRGAAGLGVGGARPGSRRPARAWPR